MLLNMDNNSRSLLIDMIKVIYEDKKIIIIDKPAGAVTHPGTGNENNTVADWLVEKYPETKNLNWPDPTRPGIEIFCFRIDPKNTPLNSNH